MYESSFSISLSVDHAVFRNPMLVFDEVDVKRR